MAVMSEANDIPAAVEAAVSPAVGRLSDRRGRIFPLRIGLGAAAVTLLGFTVPDTAAALAAGLAPAAPVPAGPT